MTRLLLSFLLLSGCDSLPFNLSGGSGSGSSSSSGGSDGGSDDGAADGASDDGATVKIEAGSTFVAKEKGGLILTGSQQGKPPEPAPGITRKQCGDLTDGGPVNGPGCATAEIECGQTIIGHTKGGGKYFDTKFYEKNFCTPATTNHSGGDERIYYVRAPEERKRLWFTLDTPCADLDLTVMRVHDAGQCPESSDDCDMWPKDGRKREIVDMTTTGGSDWIAVVEGKDEEEGAFALTLQCMDW